MTTQRFHTLLLFGCLMACSLLAQAANDRAFLWQATSDTTTVYLMGSIHFAKPDIYPLRAEIEQAFQQSDNLVVEINLDSANMLKSQQIMLTQGMYPAGDTINNHIKPDNYQTLVKFLNDNNLPVASFLQFKPAALYITLASLQLMKAGLSPDQGIDLHFTRQATGNKPILELESADYQLGLILGLPDQEALLMQTLAEFDQYEQLVEALDSTWRNGDESALQELMIDQPLREYPETRPALKALLFDRNHTMTEKIKTYLKNKESYFVVVGAAHLTGDEGIIHLLKQAGYSVKRL